MDYMKELEEVAYKIPREERDVAVHRFIEILFTPTPEEKAEREKAKQKEAEEKQEEQYYMISERQLFDRQYDAYTQGRKEGYEAGRKKERDLLKRKAAKA